MGCPTGNQEPQVAIEHLKSGWSELRCAENVKYTLEFGDLLLKRNAKESH